MDCPKCDSKMEDVTFHNITVERCTQCKGIWFPGVEHKELKAIKGSDAIDIGTDDQGRDYDEMKDVHCPTCDTAMERVQVRYKPYLHVEVCRKGHGTYFDAGEFRAFKHEDLTDFVRSLGMFIKRK